MKQQRTLTTITVSVLNTSPVCQAATESYWRKHGVPRQFNTGQWGYVETRAGLYALQSDGVGPSSPITRLNQLPLPLYPVYGGERTMVPLGEHWLVHLDDSQIRSLPILQQCDLAEFIHTGGRRLEHNFQEWEEALWHAIPVAGSPRGEGPSGPLELRVEKGSDGLTLAHLAALLAERQRKLSYTDSTVAQTRPNRPNNHLRHL